jgi:rubrerythrin
MPSEQKKTIDALKISIQMEIDGKDFYTKASQKSNNNLGKKLLTQLATEEDTHRMVFTNIYNSIQREKGWPKIDFEPDGGQLLRTVFSRAMEKTGIESKKLSTELDTVIAARQMETRTYDYYILQSQKASEAAEKEFYELVASQEQEHNLILADYYEYLQNPAGWFVKKEHPSLD